MNKDIRVALSFFNHRKTKKLIRKYGLPGAWGLLRLWSYAAESRSSGYLTGMSNSDILDETHMDDHDVIEFPSPDDFVEFMVSECKWIDRTENGLYLHDWHIHQKVQKWWYSPRAIQNALLRKLKPYKAWREDVLARDNYTCKKCGFISKSNHAHHVKPWAQYEEFRYDVRNGTTLCKDCHKKIHTEMSII